MSGTVVGGEGIGAELESRVAGSIGDEGLPSVDEN